MSKSATDVMHDIMVSAVIDAIMAMKASAKGVPNSLLRDLNAIHANTAVADLPADLQRAIDESVRAAFARLRREGYAVAPSDAVRPASPPVRRDGPPERAGRPPRPGGAPRSGRPPQPGRPPQGPRRRP